MQIKDLKVYNLQHAIKASKYPMSTDVSTLDSTITNTVKKLGSSDRGTAHDNFLHGVLVSFDLTCSNKMWVEFERYHFAEIISSQSTMHRISKLTETDCFNEYVTEETREEVKRLSDIYNETKDKEDYLKLLYNVPSGIELTAHITTNYGQLKTIYMQRYNHKLPEWRDFCKRIILLPDFKELTGI